MITFFSLLFTATHYHLVWFLPEKAQVTLHLQEMYITELLSFLYFYISILVWISVFEANLPIAPHYFVLVCVIEQTYEAGPGFLFNEIKPKKCQPGMYQMISNPE